ncbi:MAG: trigger factor [Promicromonosporaceae bacterium]|nr:trigger factor [Promicromonosporaceae bacterium]
MKSTVETLEPTKVKLSVEVDLDELKPALDKAYSEIGSQVTIPGFRKGKVPAAILNQRIGFGPIIEQAVNEVLPEYYGKAATENNLRPMAQPEVEVIEIPTSPSEGKLVFTAEVAVRPEVELPDLHNLELTVDDAVVTDDEVAANLDALRERFSTLVGTDRPARDGDFVVLDLVAKINDAEVDSVSGVSYQIGTNTMLDGLDEALTGLSAGESSTFRTKLVGGEHAGEDADVTVTATGVKERELPPIDDDFAEMASEFETVDELRDDVRKQLAEVKASRQVMDAQAKLLSKLNDAAHFDVPAVVVERAVNGHLEQENRLDDDEHRAQVTADATKGLRDQIIMDTLAEKLGIKVSQPELVDYLISLSQQYGMEPQEFISAVGQSGQIPAMVADVARSKAAAHALREVTVKDTSGNTLDLTKFIGSAESDAEQAAIEQQLFEQAAAMNQQAEMNTMAGESGEGTGEELAPSAADPAALPEF